MEQNNQKKKIQKSGFLKRKEQNKKRLDEIASKSKKLTNFFTPTVLNQNSAELKKNQNLESNQIECISEKVLPNSPLLSQVHTTSNIDSTHCFFSPSTSISTDLHISTDSGNIISENYKQTELLSQQLRLLPKTTLSQYSETSKTFEHSDLPHIDNIVNIVNVTDFNYFIKPRGKQNIQRFFSFHPQHPEKKMMAPNYRLILPKLIM